MTTPLFLLVLSSAVLHAAWNIAAKRVSGNLAVLWLGQCVVAVALAPVALPLALQMEWTTEVVLRLAITGSLQAVYFWLLSRAYAEGDISVVYPIARGLGVAGTALSAALLLKEDLSALGVTGVVLVGSGTITLGLFRTRGRSPPSPGRSPPSPGRSPAPLRWAVAIGVSLTSSATNDKGAIAVIPPLFYIFVMFALGAGVAAPAVLLRSRVQLRDALRTKRKYIFIVGVGSMASYLIVLYAFRSGPLAYITALRESSVLLGALWGFLVMRERFSAGRAAGIALILGGLVLIRLA